ncbi:sulfurtransferase [Candidimonas nitroreducens]|uniref:Sulfurtransferase n=1 Tax=Candidimonas nitroreducens TaxID=683354 RepID=A0A225M690_9BURK|nr:sulfurtransferase [Candidimonas nitroreducens]OWT56202.1 sulfurtransferase [Candidimonas nitroreducens]
MSDVLMQAEDLKAALSKGRWLVFDVRHDLQDHAAGRRAYEQGHVPGAVYLDNETQLAAPKTGRNGRHPLPAMADFAALMQACGLTPDTRVVVYDAQGGMFAAHLWWMLRWLGHEHVAVLDGGWQAWQAAGGAQESGSGRNPAAQASGAPTGAGGGQRPHMPMVDAQAVAANLEKPAFTVVDARAANRYAGEVEPMDPVAGHIPGALNRPNGQNLGADGRFKAPQELRAEFSALLQGLPAQRVVHQCGSGITACHNLFAMELAGLTGSALYPGSWSEWCSDPSRPVAKGSVPG